MPLSLNSGIAGQSVGVGLLRYNSALLINTVFEGDSRTAGNNASNAAHAYPARLTADLTGPNYSTSNLAVSGSTVADLVARKSGVDAAYKPGYYNILVVWIGLNDYISTTTTPANTYNALVSYLQSVRTTNSWQEIRVCTEPSANASNASNGTWDTWRSTYNGLITGNASNAYNGLADLAANPQIGANGTYSNTTYFYTDGIHFIDAGYALIANLVRATITKLLDSILQEITSVSPNTGNNSGTTSVTINGNGFTSGSTAKAGTTPLTGVSLTSPVALAATVPAGLSPAAYAVSVTTPLGKNTATLGSAFSATALSSATDNFVATDGTNMNGRALPTGGKTWTVFSGTWSITTNIARQTGTPRGVIGFDTGNSSHTSQVTVNSSGGAPIVGLDATGAIFLLYYSDGKLYKVTGGGSSLTQLAAWSTYTSLDVIQLIKTGNVISATKNGSSAGTAYTLNAGEITSYGSNTYVGMYGNGASARLNAFAATF